MTTREQVESDVLELKDTSELMVDLALSSLLYQNEDLAEEVRVLEDHADVLHGRIQRAAVHAAQEGTITPDQALALVRLSQAAEVIADAGREIADVVLRDVEPHPVLAASVADSDVVFARMRVDRDAALAGHTLGEVRVQSETGMHVFAIRREKSLITGPDRDDVVEAGDVLLASGPEDGREKLAALCGIEPGDEELEADAGA